MEKKLLYLINYKVNWCFLEILGLHFSVYIFLNQMNDFIAIELRNFFFIFHIFFHIFCILFFSHFFFFSKLLNFFYIFFFFFTFFFFLKIIKLFGSYFSYI